MNPLKSITKKLEKMNSDLDLTRSRLKTSQEMFDKKSRECDRLISLNVALERRLEDVNETIESFCDQCPMVKETCHECTLNRARK